MVGPIVIASAGLGMLAGVAMANRTMGGGGDGRQLPAASRWDARPRCATCGGSSRVDCLCNRWSDGDSGCRTCAAPAGCPAAAAAAPAPAGRSPPASSPAATTTTTTRRRRQRRDEAVTTADDSQAKKTKKYIYVHVHIHVWILIIYIHICIYVSIFIVDTACSSTRSTMHMFLCCSSWDC